MSHKNLCKETKEEKLVEGEFTKENNFLSKIRRRIVGKGDKGYALFHQTLTQKHMHISSSSLSLSSSSSYCVIRMDFPDSLSLSLSLSLVIHLYHSLFPAGLLDYILCQYRAVEDNF